MPVINDRHYMNPQYGMAVERERIADEEHRRVHGYPEPSWLDHFLGFTQKSRIKEAELSQQNRPKMKGHTGRGPDETIGNIIYNETSGLRPTTQNGKGSPEDLHEGRVGAGTVVKTLEAKGKKLGEPLTVTTRLTNREARAVQNYDPAKHAYEDSQSAAKKAPGDKNGPTHFYLDHGQTKPKWAIGEPKQSYGPFRNVGGGGDVPKHAKVWIRVYD